MIRVPPVCAEIVGAPGSELNAASYAQELDLCLNGPKSERLSCQADLDRHAEYVKTAFKVCP